MGKFNIWSSLKEFALLVFVDYQLDCGQQVTNIR